MALKKTWVVVSDQAQTRIYEVDNRNFSLNSIATINNDPDERMEGLRERGAVNKTSGQANLRALVNENSLQRRMLRGYVGDIANRVEKGRHEGHFQKVILVAGPEMMGLIKSKLTKPTQLLIQRALTKDYARFKEREVEAALTEDVRQSFLSA